jgi:hypothetical protein
MNKAKQTTHTALRIGILLLTAIVGQLMTTPAFAAPGPNGNSASSLKSDFDIRLIEPRNEEDGGFFCRGNTPGVGLLNGYATLQVYSSQQIENGTENVRHQYFCKHGVFNAEDHKNSTSEEVLSITIRDVYEIKDGERVRLISRIVEVYHLRDDANDDYWMDGYADLKTDGDGDFKVKSDLEDGKTLDLSIPSSGYSSE